MYCESIMFYEVQCSRWLAYGVLIDAAMWKTSDPFMNRLRTLGVLAGLLFAAGWLTSASAIPLDYTVSGTNLELNDSDPGLVLNYSLYGLPGTFTLDDGGSNSFAFADIWTNETFVNPDDMTSRTISASINFSNPLVDATVSGLTSGINLFGFMQSGVVVWNSPMNLGAADRTFELSLNNATFNTGFFGLHHGENYGATIYATVKQISSPNSVSSLTAASVPDGGSTALLLGTAMTSLGLLSCRRRSKQQ